MVQSLKEIVNCPESEIYAMLKECNIDPNVAVNRLLSEGFSNAKLYGQCNNGIEGIEGNVQRFDSCLQVWPYVQFARLNKL
ncbi:hypothetical protein RHGRI_020912 [Rhododendron griersonianum]|uniref:GBF-interacting protein 1 N-terminal domain-containing protein n=1 Tax=Rhododendron griersonianum TaxID=479676 RepID=A0AAV6JK06_9ERIC|nr:hypothetical protein RHGRI_020912 [Rhododendron griersonianum]